MHSSMFIGIVLVHPIEKQNRSGSPHISTNHAIAHGHLLVSKSPIGIYSV